MKDEYEKMEEFTQELDRITLKGNLCAIKYMADYLLSAETLELSESDRKAIHRFAVQFAKHYRRSYD